MPRWISSSFALWMLLACAHHPGPEPEGEERALTVRAEARLRVADVARAVSEVRERVSAERGFVASEQVDPQRAGLVLRVPSDRVDAVLDALAGIGSMSHRAQSREDVTEARRDTQARLRNARREEERLLALIGERASSLADVLAVECELARVRGEIEALEASARGLEDRIALAELTVTLVRSGPAWLDDPLAAIERALGEGVDAATTAAVAGAVGLAYVGPTVALGLALLFVIGTSIRRLARQRATLER